MKCPTRVRQRDSRRHRPSHRGQQRLRPQDSAAIVRSIYAYHTRTLGWCDIAYNALVDKYGQVFEGRAGGMDEAGRGRPHRRLQQEHLGCRDDRRLRRGAADTDPAAHGRPPARLADSLDHVDPRGTVTLTSDGGAFTHFPQGAPPALPTIFTHRDVGTTDCPGNAAYAAMDQMRDMAARFNDPLRPAGTHRLLRGGAIFARWHSMGGENSPLGAAEIVGGGR